MSVKSIFKIARLLELKLFKYGAWPVPDNIQPAVELILQSEKAAHPADLAAIKNVSRIDVQNSIENVCRVYCQFNVDPRSYEDLNSDPLKSQMSNYFKSKIEPELQNKFPGFTFNVVVSFFPDN